MYKVKPADGSLDEALKTSAGCQQVLQYEGETPIVVQSFSHMKLTPSFIPVAGCQYRAGVGLLQTECKATGASLS